MRLTDADALSFWNIERIQREQDKHVTAYTISPIDKKKIAEYIDKEASVCDTLKDAIDSIIHKVQDQTEMFYICEIAKLYIESQRPAEWERVDGYGGLYVCTNCGENTTETVMGKPRFNYCPNCGRRMKNGN